MAQAHPAAAAAQAAAQEVAVRIAELTGVDWHDVAVVMGSGWGPAASAFGTPSETSPSPTSPGSPRPQSPGTPAGSCPSTPVITALVLFLLAAGSALSGDHRRPDPDSGSSAATIMRTDIDTTARRAFRSLLRSAAHRPAA
jgi:purine-nucleoside phosphorylase